ncbi:MAG: molecular chaperone DnaJ [Candidatus Lokiarchaeota archaeon]|nr:molecular chaperone DnaJ [Candidatus Lokiarchaeota archaeon]
MAEDDYYDILGVERTATPEQIKRAYRKLAKKLHPDLNPGDQSAEDQFKRVNEAYEVLSDPEKRANYDRYGTADFEGVDMGGFGDIFSEIFRSFGGGFGRRGRRAGPPPGENLRVRIDLTFEEAFFGTEKEIAFRRKVQCETCKGSGAKPGTSPVTCRTCGGRGQVRRSMGGFMTVSQTCPSCRGAGISIESPCPDCRGIGLQEDRVEIKIPVPAGVEDEMYQRVTGGGNAGARGGPSGDLIIVFRVEAHDDFVRRGLHVFSEIDIPYHIAVLGGEVEVPTMYGTSKMSIPRATHGGTQFRMKGKGVHAENGRKGDQFVRVHIGIPHKISKEQKKYLEQFEDIFGQN